MILKSNEPGFPCHVCGGAGLVWSMPPHQQSLSLRQTPVNGGSCPACLGSGENFISKIQLNPPASEFLYLKFMSDQWQGIGSARAMHAQLAKQINDYEAKQKGALLNAPKSAAPAPQPPS